jgi:hypothetical protein
VNNVNVTKTFEKSSKSKKTFKKDCCHLTQSVALDCYEFQNFTAFGNLGNSMGINLGFQLQWESDRKSQISLVN